MQKAVFLDRDGTLDYDSKNYVKSISEFKIFNNTPEAIKKLNKAGYLVIIITNQSGLAREYFDEKELQRMHAKLIRKVKSAGGKIDDIYYCPHHPDDNCDCRKPGLANIHKAVKKFDINPGNSYFIGDSWKDIEAGKKAGCQTILVRTGVNNYSEQDIKSWNCQPDYVKEDIMAAVELIIDLKQQDNSK